MHTPHAPTSATLLQVAPLPPAVEEILDREFYVNHLPEGGTGYGAAQNAGDVVAVVTTSPVGASGALMKSLPNLEAVVNFGVGYETTDVDTARQLGIAVSNTPDVLTDCVADLAVGLTIDVTRGISAADRYVRRGQWPEGAHPLGRRVSGLRVGVIGLGRIGRAIARRMEAFGNTVSYHSRRRVEDVPYYWHESVSVLAAESDVLIVAVSGGPSTESLVSRDVLDALGPDGFLINIARGSVVDEDALIHALVERRIAGAALDVFGHEPHVPEALFELDNVVLTPHLGSATVETRQAMADLFLENVRMFMSTGRVRTPVF
nr:2-hydroxyacid dehydrogenase [Garicola koreensis]